MCRYGRDTRPRRQHPGPATVWVPPWIPLGGRHAPGVCQRPDHRNRPSGPRSLRPSSPSTDVRLWDLPVTSDTVPAGWRPSRRSKTDRQETEGSSKMRYIFPRPDEKKLEESTREDLCRDRRPGYSPSHSTQESRRLPQSSVTIDAGEFTVNLDLGIPK